MGGGQETGYMMCRLVPITHSGIVVLPVFCFHRRIPELRAPPPIQKVRPKKKKDTRQYALRHFFYLKKKKEKEGGVVLG